MRKRIFEVPYLFDAKVVLVRCQNSNTGLLRGAVFCEFDMLDGSEAPVVAEIAPSPAEQPAGVLVLRHDGRSLLRPVRSGRGDVRLCGALIDEDAFRRIAEFDAGVEISDGEFPAVWLRHGMKELQNVRQFGRRMADILPGALHTAEDAPVKRWDQSGAEKAATGARTAVADYAFVDGVLHRRVPPPLWRSQHYRRLLQGEDVASSLREISGEPTFWWPISMTEDMVACYANIEPAHLRPAPRVLLHDWPDLKADLAYSGSVALRSVRNFVNLAVPRLQDENIERFMLYRTAAAAAETDFEACQSAMDLLAAMVEDPEWGTGQPRAYTKWTSASIIKAQIRHWRRLVRDAGTGGLTEEDDAALEAFAA